MFALATFLYEVEVWGLFREGGGASLEGCGGRAVPAGRGRRRVVVCVVRRGRSVVADPVVRVRFPPTVVDVVRSCWDCRSGGDADREARWDERGLVGRECGLIVRLVRVYPAGIPYTGRGETRSELSDG